jgi:hypothetical protein
MQPVVDSIYELFVDVEALGIQPDLHLGEKIFFFSLGPGVYVPDALQPLGLLYNPVNPPTLVFGRSHCHCQMSPRLSRRERSKQQKVELMGGNVIREFCLNANFHVTFRDLSHAANLRHETDGFTSPLKEGALRIFCP